MLNKKTLALSFAALMFFSTRGLCQDPVPVYPENYKVLLENDRVRVLDFQLRKGAKENFHSHPAAVTYVLSPFKIRFAFPDGQTRVREAKAGEVFFGEAITHSPENIGDTDAYGILVELKAPIAAKAAQTPAEDEWLTAVTFIRGVEGKEEEAEARATRASGSHAGRAGLHHL